MSPGRCGLLGLLAGAAAGLAEMSLRLQGGLEDPSVARRAAGLLFYAAALYSSIFFLAFTTSGILLRRAEKRGWPSARGRRSLAAGLLTAGGVAAFGLAGLGDALWQGVTAVKLGALAAAAGASILAGWTVARLLALHPGNRLERASAALLAPRLWAVLSALSLLATGAWAWRLTVTGPAPHPGPTSVAGGETGGDADPPNMILILVDTLRSDELGCYVSRPGLTPAVDRLAAAGVVFRNAYAQSSWTLPSVVSLLSSTMPAENGFTDFDSVLPSGLRTLPEVLAAAGYEVHGIVGNPLMNAGRGFARGYHFYDVYDYDLEGQLSLSRAIGGFLRLSGLVETADRQKSAILWLDPSRFPWLTTRLTFYVQDEELNGRLDRYDAFAPGRPHFLYVHYVSPHSPYLAHPYRFFKTQPRFAPGNLDLLRTLYRGEVGYVDSVVGDLLASLERKGLLKNSILAFVSDHGEEFLEHGRWEHGHSLYEEVLRVPLILSAPGLAPGRVEDQVELLDLAPTLLDLAGVPIPSSFRGRSLRPLLQAAGPLTPRPAFAETTSRYLNPQTDYRCAILGNWKIIRKRKPSGRLLSEEVYDLGHDRKEEAPMIWDESGAAGQLRLLRRRELQAGGRPLEALSADTPRIAALRAELDEFERQAASRFSRERKEPSEQELQRLRSLGYIR